MGTLEPGDIWALVAGFTLAASVPLGAVLGRRSDRHLHLMESFAAGASLAYVVVDLLVELTAVGSAHVRATLPIGPTDETSLFVVVLAGATCWYVVAALAARMAGPRGRYSIHILPHTVYCLFVGGALALEGEHGTGSVFLFALPMLLHLTVVECHIHRQFQREHRGSARLVLALAPGVGAAARVIFGLPESVLFMALALVAGSTVVQIVQTELPSPDVLRIGPFVLGVCVYLGMVAGRWAS